jgi:hypothetical protein
MKTFGLFCILWLIYLIVIFNFLLPNIGIDQMLKLILSTQMTYIMYRLLKEEYYEDNKH